jgi:3-hydroxyacyl-[acyl-carrier-protein] dehydratase
VWIWPHSLFPTGGKYIIYIDFRWRRFKKRTMSDGAVVSPEVLNAIPHRPPFLFVDKVLVLQEDYVEAERILRADEFFFRGHYPQMAIMPGVLLGEAIFQTAGILLSHVLMTKGADVSNKVPVLTRIQEAKFKRMVFPGDALHLEAKLLQILKDFYFFKGMARREGQVCMTIQFVLGLIAGTAGSLV